MDGILQLNTGLEEERRIEIQISQLRPETLRGTLDTGHGTRDTLFSFASLFGCRRQYSGTVDGIKELNAVVIFASIPTRCLTYIKKSGRRIIDSVTL